MWIIYNCRLKSVVVISLWKLLLFIGKILCSLLYKTAMVVVAQLFTRYRICFCVYRNEICSLKSISQRRFSTLYRIKKNQYIPPWETSRLNHFIKIRIYNEELDKINIKLITNNLIKVKDSRIAIFRLHQFWAFTCFSLFINA